MNSKLFLFREMRRRQIEVRPSGNVASFEIGETGGPSEPIKSFTLNERAKSAKRASGWGWEKGI